MIKKKELREKLQQRQILKRDLNDGPPIPINSGDIQILEERSTSSSAFIQKSTTPTSATTSSSRSAPLPPDVPRSAGSRAATANHTHPPGVPPPTSNAQTPHRSKGVKPPRPGEQLWTNFRSACMNCTVLFKQKRLTVGTILK